MSKILKAAVSGQQARISVVIACYNAEKTLEKTVGSLLKQTVEDWELIIVNDGSTDNSLECACGLMKQDRRISVVSQKNQGPSIARNAGVKAARTGMIAFLDADDLWREDHLATSLSFLEDNPDIALCYAGCAFLGAGGILTGDRSKLSSQPLAVQDILSSNPTTTCSALVFHKEIYKSTGGLRSDMKFAEDQEWLFRVMTLGGKIQSTGHYTVYYHTSEDGLSANLEKMAAGWEHFIALARQDQPDLVRRYYHEARSEMAWYHARRSVRTGQSFQVTWRYLWRSLVASPVVAFRRPASFLAISLASFFPVVAGNVQKRLRQKIRPVQEGVPCYQKGL